VKLIWCWCVGRECVGVCRRDKRSGGWTVRITTLCAKPATCADNSARPKTQTMEPTARVSALPPTLCATHSLTPRQAAGNSCWAAGRPLLLLPPWAHRAAAAAADCWGAPVVGQEGAAQHLFCEHLLCDPCLLLLPSARERPSVRMGPCNHQ
jgi:hypothetical protein